MKAIGHSFISMARTIPYKLLKINCQYKCDERSYSKHTPFGSKMAAPPSAPVGLSGERKMYPELILSLICSTSSVMGRMSGLWATLELINNEKTFGLSSPNETSQHQMQTGLAESAGAPLCSRYRTSQFIQHRFGECWLGLVEMTFKTRGTMATAYMLIHHQKHDTGVLKAARAEKNEYLDGKLSKQPASKDGATIQPV